MTPAMFHIALALSDGPRHGYGLMRDVELLSSGAMQLGPGTLYRSLQRMSVESLIEELPSEDKAADERRRDYQLTVLGREALDVEARRLAAVVAIAAEKGIVEAVEYTPTGAQT